MRTGGESIESRIVWATALMAQEIENDLHFQMDVIESANEAKQKARDVLTQLQKVYDEYAKDPSKKKDSIRYEAWEMKEDKGQRTADVVEGKAKEVKFENQAEVKREMDYWENYISQLSDSSKMDNTKLQLLISQYDQVITRGSNISKTLDSIHKTIISNLR